MPNEIQLATPEQIALGEKIHSIFLPTAAKRRDEMRARGGRMSHYTTAEAALSIIRNKTLWLRNTTAMADYSEVQHGYREIGNHPELAQLLTTLDQQIPGLGTAARNEFAKWWKDIQFQSFLASVSEHDESEDLHGRLSMWRGFARASSRVALVFRAPMKSGTAQPLRLIMHPVEYFTPAELGTELKTVAANVVRDRSFLASQDQTVVTAFAFISLLLNVVGLKHEGFREEREWRLVHLPKLLPSPLMKSSVETIDGVPQRIFKLPLDGGGAKGLEDVAFKTLIDRVIVGPTPYPWVMYDAFVQELKDAGIDDAERKVFVSGIPIRT